MPRHTDKEFLTMKRNLYRNNYCRTRWIEKTGSEYAYQVDFLLTFICYECKNDILEHVIAILDNRVKTKTHFYCGFGCSNCNLPIGRLIVTQDLIESISFKAPEEIDMKIYAVDYWGRDKNDFRLAIDFRKIFKNV